MAPQAGGATWRPAAGLDALLKRAQILARIRAFFAERGVLEVETPVLAAAPVSDPHLQALSCRLDAPGGERRLFLQTSPEYAMKRLLAAGSGPIYQVVRAFRDGEVSPLHNPEFTMLEWYRPGFDHHSLMDEMDGLLFATLGAEPAERLAYGDVFRHRVGLDPHRAEGADLAAAAAARGIEVVGMDAASPKDDWLHLLMSHVVEPTLGLADAGEPPRPTFLYDYPASQAALARVRRGQGVEPAVAERFEVYVAGVELANGFHELADVDEQRRRFVGDLEERRQRGLPAVPVDEHLLAALAHGLPDCAGVALGVDRLVMLASSAEHIGDVLAFPVDRA